MRYRLYLHRNGYQPFPLHDTTSAAEVAFFATSLRAGTSDEVEIGVKVDTKGEIVVVRGVNARELQTRLQRKEVDRPWP